MPLSAPHETGMRRMQALDLGVFSRFPKNLEREAEVLRKSAELIVTLSPDDF